MTKSPAASDPWPPIPFGEWQPTASALHLYLQIAGKYRLARSPWINHAWHATFYVVPCGLSTSLIPDGDGGIEILFDLVGHSVICQGGNGQSLSIPLQAMSVADFHRQFVRKIGELGGNPAFHGRPNEIADAVPFAEDTAARPYDAAAVSRFQRALVSVDAVFQDFRTGFRGKASPVHLFWGSFDLAVTRFSGRRAPLHPGGILNLPDAVTREAYSHEVSSAGFWPGGGPIDEPAFYSYAYPQPAGFAEADVRPAAASYNKAFGEFILPYEAVRNSKDPRSTLLAFLESTYERAATLGNWDRTLECQRGRVGSPPSIETHS